MCSRERKGNFRNSTKNDDETKFTQKPLKISIYEPFYEKLFMFHRVLNILNEDFFFQINKNICEIVSIDEFNCTTIQFFH